MLWFQRVTGRWKSVTRLGSWQSAQLPGPPHNLSRSAGRPKVVALASQPGAQPAAASPGRLMGRRQNPVLPKSSVRAGAVCGWLPFFQIGFVDSKWPNLPIQICVHPWLPPRPQDWLLPRIRGAGILACYADNPIGVASAVRSFSSPWVVGRPTPAFRSHKTAPMSDPAEAGLRPVGMPTPAFRSFTFRLPVPRGANQSWAAFPQRRNHLCPSGWLTAGEPRGGTVARLCSS